MYAGTIIIIGIVIVSITITITPVFFMMIS